MTHALRADVQNAHTHTSAPSLPSCKRVPHVPIMICKYIFAERHDRYILSTRSRRYVGHVVCVCAVYWVHFSVCAIVGECVCVLGLCLFDSEQAATPHTYQLTGLSYLCTDTNSPARCLHGCATIYMRSNLQTHTHTSAADCCHCKSVFLYSPTLIALYI